MSFTLGLFMFMLTVPPAVADFSNHSSTQCPVPPTGYYYENNCRLLCHPVAWTDIIVFYLTNYAAHAATIVTRPGQSKGMSLLATISALLLPGTGLRAGIEVIAARAKLGRTDLEVAARAGALCAIVKESEELWQDLERHQSGVSPIKSATVHGICHIPRNYALMTVPATATFENDDGDKSTLMETIKRRMGFGSTRDSIQTTISCNYNVIKIIISLAQMLFAVSTLYRARGNQIARFGYAAFGLTVAPYAWMSLINLVAHLLCPQYDAMFVVDSAALDELRESMKHASDTRQKQFLVAGTVGRLTGSSEEKLKKAYQKEIKRYYGSMLITQIARSQDEEAALFTMATWLAGSIPVAIVAALSHFHAGQSTVTQRALTMTWLAMGVVYGAMLSSYTSVLKSDRIVIHHRRKGGLTRCVKGYFAFSSLAILYGPAIAGFYFVGQMIYQFGICIRL